MDGLMDGWMAVNGWMDGPCIYQFSAMAVLNRFLRL